MITVQYTAMRIQLYNMLHSNTAFNIDLQLKLEEVIMLFHVSQLNEILGMIVPFCSQETRKYNKKSAACIKNYFYYLLCVREASLKQRDTLT